MEIKHCRDCNQDLPLTEFTRNRRNNDGLAFYCAPCSRARVVASRRRRLGPPRTRNRQGPKDVPPGLKWCPECDAVKPADEFPVARRQANGRGAYCNPCFNRIINANRVKHHGSARNYHLRRRYGIGVDDFDRMSAEQGGVCAICRDSPAKHVDHDHESGRVRGLLCFNCNGALGQFRDRPDLMLRAVGYLRHGSAAINADDHDPIVGVILGTLDDLRPPDEPHEAVAG